MASILMRLSDHPRLQRLIGADWLTLVLVAVILAGMWQHASAAPPDKPADAGALADEEREAKNDDSAPSKNQSKVIAYHGRVVDEDGKPVVGAEIWYVLPTAISSPLGEIIGSGSIRKVTITDSEGNFAFSVPPPVWTGHRFAVDSVPLIAKTPGYGCDWIPLAAFESDPVASEQRAGLQSRTDNALGEGRFASRTLKLPRAADPIRGRLVDLEGQPLAGVEVCVQSIHNVNIKMLTEAFETSTPDLSVRAVSMRASPGWLSSVDWQVLFPRSKTSETGEFTLTGLGHSQMADVTLHHDRVDAELLHIVGAPIQPQRLARSRRLSHAETYLGKTFTHAVGPGGVVSGIVTDSQDGKPIANARVYVERLFSQNEGNSTLRFARYIQTRTDEQGHYKLVGVPLGTGHVLEVMPPTSQPLFALTQGFEIHSAGTKVDMELLRGIWIEGNVTDSDRGEPVRGTVDYFPFRQNAEAAKLNGKWPPAEAHRFMIDESGQYRVPGLKGPGAVMVTAYGGKVYPKAAGADKIEGYDAKTGRLPSVMVNSPLVNWHQVSFVDPPPEATSYEHNVSLAAGLSLNGHVIGPDDQPASDIEVLGQVPRDNFFRKLKDATFTVTDYTAEQSRDLFFQAKNQSLVGHLHLAGPQPKEVLTVRLQAAVTVHGRLIDTERNEPATKFQLFCRSSKQGRFRVERATTDDDGKFELKGLLAGNVYQMDASDGQGFVSLRNGFSIDLTKAASGDVVELGDVTGKNASQPSPD